MNMDIEDDFTDFSKQKISFHMNNTSQNTLNTLDNHYHSRFLNQAVSHQIGFHPEQQDQSMSYHHNHNHQLQHYQPQDMNQQQPNTPNMQDVDNLLYSNNGHSYSQIIPEEKACFNNDVRFNESSYSKINSDKTVDSQNQSSSLNDENSSKNNKDIVKKKKKKKLRTQFKDINPYPSLHDFQAYLLKGNILLELNRNQDSQDYLPIGFKMNPYNAWKPIQKVITHNNYNCIEIQVANSVKPEEDFEFIIKVLTSYGDSKYREIALSLQKYQHIIKATKMMEEQLNQQKAIQINSSSNLSTKLPQSDKTNQAVNQLDYEKAFFKQFYERAMEVLGSMNKAGENIFFAFTMGKFDNFGFYDEMFNFGVNKNFLLLLGSEMDQVSNAFLRNGWLEIFDYETRVNNSLNFVNLINHGYEKEMMEMQAKQQGLNQQGQSMQDAAQQSASQQSQSYGKEKGKNQQQQQQQERKQEQQSGSQMKEMISEAVDIVVNTFDQIKVPAKMTIHDIKINSFALRINMIDISPNLLQQVYAIRQKYINEKKSVNYIQMFDQNFIYTTESQNFLKTFYPNHSAIQSTKKGINPFDIHELPSVRQEIEKFRCGFRFVN